ncbi:MAG: hypothetical protein HZR80_04560 [Candidatus Heimdallarchaeota archaeon]
MPKVTYEPISAKDALKQIRDLVSIMVDLAYSSIVFEDKGLADEVKEIRDLVVYYNYLLTMSLQIAVRDSKDAQATLPLVVLGQSSEDLANSATDISNVLLKGFAVHQTIKDMAQRVARDLMRGKISDESILKGYTINEIKQKMNYSVTIYGLRHEGKWQIKPDQETKLEAGDIILASGSGSGISLLKLLVGGTAEEISPPDDDDEDDVVGESLAENIVDYLIAMKDTSEVMVELAYGAVLYNNKELAQLVSNMEKRVDTIRNKAEIAVLRLAKSTSEDISSLQGLLRIVEATERISDSANQISKIVLAELPSHPIIELVIGESADNIFESTVEESSLIVGKTIPAGNYLDEFGIRVLAIKRAGGHYFKPRRRTKIRANDTIIFTGARDACDAFQQKEVEAEEVKEAELEATKKAAEMVVDEVVDKVTDELSEKAAREISKKTAKEIARKAAEKAAEKVTSKAASEAAEEVAEKITNEMTEKIVNEVVQETIETVKAEQPEIDEKTVKAAVEAAVKKSVDDAKKKVEKAAKEAAENELEEKSDEVKQKATKAAAKKAAEKVETIVKDAVKLDTERTAKRAATEAIKETVTIDEPVKLVKDAATEAAKEVVDKAAERAIERSGKRVATKAAEEAALEAATKEAKKVAKKAAKEAAEEVLEKEVKKAVQKAAKEAAEQVTKD